MTDGEQLCALEYEDYEPRMLKYLQAQFVDLSLSRVKTPTCKGLQPTLLTCLDAYFSGDFSGLMTVPVNLKGTAFQQQVWSCLRKIPVGTTMTYGALALQLGKPNASRAVGLANARNPVAIAIPCHRVIGANAQL
ncbi:MAG: methylated-DNA--[protein]-cysteine S-methyltransferase, partial [Thermosynechococcaceae cyanobacterium]